MMSPSQSQTMERRGSQPYYGMIPLDTEKPRPRREKAGDRWRGSRGAGRVFRCSRAGPGERGGGRVVAAGSRGGGSKPPAPPRLGGPSPIPGSRRRGGPRGATRANDWHLPGDRLRIKMAEDKDKEELALAEFHKKIKEAFEVFDHESNNTVDVEEEEPTGYIRYEKFLPVMTKVLLERRYRPIPEDVLLRAFEVLDSAKRGFLTKEELIKYMTEEGEPFSQEEMEEMLSAAIDPDSNSINYKEYIAMMVIDEN
ncbi:dynein regulatory complex protein 8 isoform X2 [Marmota monax]|uniref:dynein regulatory complex protein 8 isoform X2 n=1 Tax=Marmota monax TaxID=9995 RepID=UPI001EAF98C5|nr:dynein regulatory complex protein 8 isoform X2 [Marmota monax]